MDGRLNHSVRAIICVYVTGDIDSSDRTEIRIISDAVYVSYLEPSYTIVELLLAVPDFLLFAENPSGLVKFRSVLNVNIFFL